ncbi:MAG: type I toxin-antitoxin system SymE family toxin [Oscillospiraceae bacterium]|nr:type I toxin-antitoxin system SymE family toxin [Oscillospiraceae bacterium]
MDNMRFTVGAMPTNDKRKISNPSVWLGGKWLSEYGFAVGDKLELIQGKNMLVLVKVAAAD